MGIPLSKALAELRRELYAAQEAGVNEQFQFEVEQAQLSLELEFRDDGHGNVKVEIGAFGTSAGADFGAASGRTHRQVLTLTLQVLDGALNGERARVRRPSGGLPAEDRTAVPQGEGAASTEGRLAVPDKNIPEPWD
ncbi:trypco2 family protein [Streptomyces huasconensis]|uniref:Trypco2 family protein n=1 Tax=Streptomyces huasconensis TaxID=1854574 RepID=A0ABV3LZD4_9ACTN